MNLIPLNQALRHRKLETWTTEDGRVIPVHELDDDHLRNIALFLIKRADRIRWRYLAVLAKYIDTDPPDGAFNHAGVAMMILLSMTEDEILESFFGHICREVRRRGLKTEKDGYWDELERA